MPNRQFSDLNRGLKWMVRRLLGLNAFLVAAIFIVAAVVISVVIVMTFDLLWDGRFNAELEIAGVVTPFLDAFLVVGLFTVLLNELREEVERRKAAEYSTRKLNEELEAKVVERTRQLLAAQDELVRREKLTLLAQVADSVGHELRNPLGVMSNAVYFLKSVLSDAGESTKEYLGIVECEIAESERIVADLLDAVRTKPPQFETAKVAELIEQALRKCAVPPAVTISLDIPETLPPLNVDPKQIQQVLSNLITNGLEAMPEGGALEIRATENRRGRTLRISVKDSGVGIAPEHQDKLFQPLFTTKTRRVGLGLAAVKNLIQVNRGSVDMQSEPGKGSTFCVTLPTGGSDAEIT
jgi:signal transduction histidine kinase